MTNLNHSPVFHPWLHKFLICVAFFLALSGWLFILLLTLAWTEGTLVPWDTLRMRPPPESLELKVNNFFEAGFGAYLPAILLCGISLYLFVRGIISNNWMVFLRKFVLSQLLFFLFGLVVISPLLYWTNVWLQASNLTYEVGYLYKLPSILCFTVLSTFLLLYQWRLSKESKMLEL